MSGLAKEGLNRFYKDFLRICQRWPVDASRSGRDFGEHIRISYDAKFKDGVFEVSYIYIYMIFFSLCFCNIFLIFVLALSILHRGERS